MKTLLVLTTSLLATSVVHAEPSAISLESSASPAPTPTSSVSGGVMLGADHAIVAALSLDGELQLRGSLWLHGMIAKGTAAGVDEPNHGGNYAAGRIGVAERGCLIDALCAVAGVDVGYRHVAYMAEYDSANISGVVVVPRIGLDVGTPHLRFRPGIEGIVDGSNHNTVFGFDGLDLTAAIAYRW